MKKTLFCQTTLLFTFLSIFSLTVSSCKKQEATDPDENEQSTAKGDVRTFEIVHLSVPGALSEKYTGTFGDVSTELMKTSDSTLTFFVPDVPAGKQVLKFELGNFSFNVIKTQAINAEELVTGLFLNFDAQVNSLNASTPEEIAEVNELKQYKQEVTDLFNKLTPDEKRQAALFYEANKATFQSFVSSTYSTLNAPTTFSKNQSDCPKTNRKTFYGCTAENLGKAADSLAKCSKDFLYMLALTGASAYLAPASFGLSAFGTVLGLGTSAYLLMVEVRPAALHFKKALYPFLEANWIFGKDLFSGVTTKFADQTNTPLSLKPKFRSLTSGDASVNPGSSYFINSMTKLSEYWNKLTALFGNFPGYKNTSEPTTLSQGDITVSNISNPKVQLQGQSGEQLKFKTLTGNEETFSYTLTVQKEGFTETKNLNGTVLKAKDTLEVIRDLLEGKVWTNGRSAWEVDDYVPYNYIEFVECCFGASQADYFFRFMSYGPDQPIKVNGISGFNGNTIGYTLTNLSATGFQLIPLDPAGFTITFPR